MSEADRLMAALDRKQAQTHVRWVREVYEELFNPPPVRRGIPCWADLRKEGGRMAGFTYAQNMVDDDHFPAGGFAFGPGFTIAWQDGPCGEGADIGAVLEAVVNRLAFFQSSHFACSENAEAIEGINHALGALDRRTADRTNRGVEGTYKT